MLSTLHSPSVTPAAIAGPTRRTWKPSARSDSRSTGSVVVGQVGEQTFSAPRMGRDTKRLKDFV